MRRQPAIEKALRGAGGDHMIAAGNMTIDGLKESSYTETIEELEKALEQFRSMERGEYQPCCFVCHDTGHTAEQCWYFNPLLVMAIGQIALISPFYRCYHCGAIYTDEQSAEQHFGKTPNSPAECLRQLAEISA